MDNSKLGSYVDSLGFIAETALIFYRDLIKAGATEEEAGRITQACIAAIMIVGNSIQKPPTAENN